MNILVLTEMYPRRTDPTAGVFVHRECLALRGAGLDFRVLSPLPYAPRILWNNPKWKDLGLVPRADAWDGIPVRYPRYPRTPGSYYRKLEAFAMFPRLCAAFKTWSREKPFDLIHAHGLLPCGLAATLLSKVFRVPCVCHARGSDVNTYSWESKANFLLSRHVIDNCNAPVAVSNALAQKMSSISRTRRRIDVLYTTVDTELFTPVRDKASVKQRLGIGPKTFVAIYVGQLSREKGVADLVQAWKDVGEKLPTSLLAIVGEGYVPQKLGKLTETVLLCGTKPHSEVASWMQAGDVLVLPSYSEGLPTVVVEAMACELAVIATPVGGIPEAVVHGETGLLVPTGDCRRLASSLLTLAHNEGLRRSMGRAGRKRMQALFSRDTYVSNACSLYRSVLEGSTRQRYKEVRCAE